MKISSHYKLREIAGETVVVKQGKVGSDLTTIISLNSSAALLYRELSGKDFSQEDVTDVLLSHYDIDEALAKKDGTKWVNDLIGCGVLEK